MSLDAASWSRILALFEEARSLPLAEREAFLKVQCGEDTDLSILLRELLDEADPEPDVQEISNSDLRGRAHGLEEGLVLGDYRIVRELGRGGMGIVYEAVQLSLGRPVALKVVNTRFSDRRPPVRFPRSSDGPRGRADDRASSPPASPAVLERFVEEARISGQLQHPGIVPVYGLGLLPDGRHYFAMKLVEGRTLASMLEARTSPQERRAQFLNIFEVVCQTIAYAHSKRVIHRDLKPANVMVGAFGEVQILDWGLSKVLPVDDVGGGGEAAHGARSRVQTSRSRGASRSSVLGSILGTPAYMAPEQARGELDGVDMRTDVFGLGAILCEIITGLPPHVASRPGENLILKAAFGEMTEAQERVQRSVAAPELKALCVTALATSREARQRDAGEVARAIHEHLTGLEQRAHEERLNAERSRRQTQLSLLGSLFLVLTMLGAGGGWWFVDSQRRERWTQVSRAYDDVLAQVHGHERAEDFGRALDAARAGLRLVETGDADPELRAKAAAQVVSTEEGMQRHQELLARAEAERQLLTFLDEHSLRWMFPGDDSTRSEVDIRFARAFREFGIDLDSPDLARVLGSYMETRLGVQLAQGFDAWARILRRLEREAEPGEWPADEVSGHGIEFLTGIGLDLDSDPIRSQARMALLAREAAPLVDLVRPEQAATTPPETLLLVCTALLELGEIDHGLGLATLAADLHPSDFSLNVVAASFHTLGERSLGKAELYLRTAAALRPDIAGVHATLGHLLSSSGDLAGAIVAKERAVQLAPDYPWDYDQLGHDCMGAGQLEKAIAYLGRPEGTEVGLRAAQIARVLTGELRRDDFFEWAAGLPSRGPAFWSQPALLLTVHVPAGLEPEPGRALDLLWFHDSPRRGPVEYWLCVAAAHVLLGEGETAIAAASRLEKRCGGDRIDQSIAYLLAAAGHALVGDRKEAELLLRRAHALRDELVNGREQEWSGSLIEAAFERFEPIARGR